MLRIMIEFRGLRKHVQRGPARPAGPPAIRRANVDCRPDRTLDARRPHGVAAMLGQRMRLAHQLPETALCVGDPRKLKGAPEEIP